MTNDILKELDAFRHDLGDFKEKWQDDDIWSVLDQAADKIDIDAIRIEKLEAALRKIADIEHEDLPKPAGAAEGTLWVILAGCVEVAEKALEGKDD
jgi:hypothetical protein